MGNGGVGTITYKENPISLSSEFSAETLQARRKWNKIFKTLKEKNHQPKLIYSSKLSFRYEEAFPDQ